MFASMSSAELIDTARKLYGRTGWSEKLAGALGVDGSTVRRWVSGAVPVPNPVAVAVRLLGQKAKKR